MSDEELVSRMLSTEAMVDSYRLRTGELSKDDWKKIGVASSKLVGCDIVIDSSSEATVTSMRAKLRREQNKKKEIGLVVIDYLQLMRGEKNTDNRVQEVGEISRNLKLLAKDFGVPILCCAQLSRKPEGRQGGQKPMLSDLRDSGSIEQDADMVMFLYREDYYNEELQNSDTKICEVSVAKNRHGSLGTVKLGWLPQYTKFRTIVDDNDPNRSPMP